MEDKELIGSVDSRSLNDFIRNRGNVLFHHENTESAEHCRDDQGLVAVHPAKALDHGIFRNDGYTPWNHHGRKHKTKQEVSAFEFVFAQHEAADRTRIDHQQSYHHSNQKAVQEKSYEIEMSIHVDIVVQDKFLGQQMLLKSHDLAVLFKGREQHPHKGIYRNRSNHQKNEIQNDTASFSFHHTLLFFRSGYPEG